MTLHYPIVFETEASGAISVYVPGLPVYAAADTQRKAERAIHDVLAAYLDAHPEVAESSTAVKVARIRRFATRPAVVAIVGPAALVGTVRSALRLLRHGSTGALVDDQL